jgi:pimeloyl-ACP methyl ester carboxylesterase
VALIVLLPGLDGTGDLFRPLLDVVPACHRTRVLSYPADRASSYPDLFRLIETELEGDREIVLLAESFSGPLAVRFAAAHPDRVRAVVLCASFVRPPLPRWILRLAVPGVFFVPPPAFVIRRLMLGRGAPDPLVRAVRAAIRRVSPRVLAGRLREVAGVDCAANLRECRAPMLYFAATNDRLVRRSAVDAVLAARADVTVGRVEGPHLLLQREPVRAWREIERFLDEIRSPGGNPHPCPLPGYRERE